MWFKRCLRCRAEYSWLPLSPGKSTRSLVHVAGWCDRCGPTAFAAAYDDDESRKRPEAIGAPTLVLVVAGILALALLAVVVARVA